MALRNDGLQTLHHPDPRHRLQRAGDLRIHLEFSRQSHLDLAHGLLASHAMVGTQRLFGTCNELGGSLLIGAGTATATVSGVQQG